MDAVTFKRTGDETMTGGTAVLKRAFSLLLMLSLSGCVGGGDSQPTEYERTSAGVKKHDDADCLTTITTGDVQGTSRGESCAYTGIPYAAAPVGALRWAPPQPAASWAPAVFSATGLPGLCPQRTPAGVNQGVEDCLKLGVFTPSPAPHKAPVLVWFHTGNFIASTSGSPSFDGERIAEQTGAIVVTLNYRLGALGFLSHPELTAEDPSRPSSGNYGILDQRLALEWVQDNIAAFGGDRKRVAIAGISAGAESASVHVVSPGSAGLFKRAIIQSGTFTHRAPTLAQNEAQGNTFATNIGCTTAPVLPCLRTKTRDQVLVALANYQAGWSSAPGVRWSPVVDGLELPDQPRTLYEQGASGNVRVIVGSARDDGFSFVQRSFPAAMTAAQYTTALNAEFGATLGASVLAQYPVADYISPKEALSHVATDLGFVCEARRVARLVTLNGGGEDEDEEQDEDELGHAYLYSFERITSDPLHVPHATDHPFVFGNPFAPGAGPAFDPNLNPDNVALYQSVMGYWTRFADKGKPNHGNDGELDWPRYGVGSDTDEHLVIDVPLSTGTGLRATQCDFWDQHFLRSPILGPQAASAP
jgi:para-nitrobenzyl esterase